MLELPPTWPVTHFSVSQMDLFERCQRKWWIQYVDKWHRPGGVHFLIGTALHAAIERHLKNEDPFPKGWAQGLNLDQAADIRAMFRAGLKEGLLPEEPSKIDSPYSVEAPFTLSMEGGELPFFVGFIDLEFIEANLVIDWKTTSSWYYSKTSQDLKENTQVLIYAKVLQHKRRELGLPESEGFSVAHGIFLKKTHRNYKEIDSGAPRTRYVKTDVSWPEAERRWQKCVSMARAMVSLARKATAWHQIPAPKNRKDSCDAFGGCEYKDVCFSRLTKEQWHKQNTM